MYPGLWAIGVQLHSTFTGSYVPGHHSVLLVNSPNEQAAKDIGRYTTRPRQITSLRTSVIRFWWESHAGLVKTRKVMTHLVLHNSSNILIWMISRELTVKVETIGVTDCILY